MAATKAAGSMAIEILKLDVVRWLFLALLIAGFLLFIRSLVRSTIREYRTEPAVVSCEEDEE